MQSDLKFVLFAARETVTARKCGYSSVELMLLCVCISEFVRQ